MPEIGMCCWAPCQSCRRSCFLLPFRPVFLLFLCVSSLLALPLSPPHPVMIFDLSSSQPFSRISFDFLSPPVRCPSLLFALFLSNDLAFIGVRVYNKFTPSFFLHRLQSTGHQSLIIPSRPSLHHPKAKNQFILPDCLQ